MVRKNTQKQDPGLDEKILSVLRPAQTYVSSDELIRLADISRAAIWKHIEKLREEGYDIEAAPHLGYRLRGIPDRLIPAEIRCRLTTRILGSEILSYQKLDSTNDLAYLRAVQGAPDGTLVLAETQEKGRGRHGRSWSSPPGGGIYMSVVLRPDISPGKIPRITLLTAVAVARSIRQMTGLNARIKWPNDILLNDKKVCGILTEMKAEQDRVDFVIVGIGVNVMDAARSLPRTATSLREETSRVRGTWDLTRIELVCGILKELEGAYTALTSGKTDELIQEWKQFSVMMGERVRIVLPRRTVEGVAFDLDDDGALVVRLDSGTLERFSSGDVVMVR